MFGLILEWVMVNVTLMCQRVLAQMKDTFELDPTEKLGRDAIISYSISKLFLRVDDS